MSYKIMADAVIDLEKNLTLIQERICNAVKKRPAELPKIDPVLVAVSKTKPLISIKKAYDAGQRHFGENYLKELVIKSTNPDITSMCPDIKWHYIGMLQTKMASTLMRVKNLHMVETISSKSQADALNSRWKDNESLSVFVQVNTSGEENKSGADPSGYLDLVSHIHTNCNQLHFRGLMTIGAAGHDFTSGPNPDFEFLRQCRDEVCRSLELDVGSVGLSMGMSADFEEAIKAGSTEVRVGSQIFGSRDYPAKEPN